MLAHWQAWGSVRLNLMFVHVSHRTLMGHNYSRELLGAAVKIGYNLSESLFALLLSASNRVAVRQVEAGLISFIKNSIWPICCFLTHFPGWVFTCTRGRPQSPILWRMHPNSCVITTVNPWSSLPSAVHARTHAGRSIDRLAVYVLDNKGSWLRDRFIMQNVSLRDAVFWFHSFILNSGGKLVCDAVVCPEWLKMRMVWRFGYICFFPSHQVQIKKRPAVD